MQLRCLKIQSQQATPLNSCRNSEGLLLASEAVVQRFDATVWQSNVGVKRSGGVQK
jgi:hypothetical protein